MSGLFNLNDAEVESAMLALGTTSLRGDHPKTCFCVHCTLFRRLKWEWMKDRELEKLLDSSSEK